MKSGKKIGKEKVCVCVRERDTVRETEGEREINKE